MRLSPRTTRHSVGSGVRAAGRYLEADGTRALAILREDRAYLEALARGEDPALPIARRTKAQRAIHAENLTRR